MKGKHSLALILALSLLVSGCTADDPIPDETTPDETAAVFEETAPRRTSSPPESDPPAEDLSAREEEALDSVSYRELIRANLLAEEAVQEILRIPETLEYSNVRYISPTELSVSDLRVTPRFSTREMGKAALYDATQAASCSNVVGSDLYTFNDPILRVGTLENGTLPIESAELSYRARFEEPRAFRGFVRISTVNEMEIILEPADLREIPLFSRREEDLTFTVNGETMYADTISVTVRDSYDTRGNRIISEVEKQVGVGSKDYVYAEFVLDGLTVSYNTESGYQNKAEGVDRFTILTTDTAAVIRGDQIFGHETDSAQAEALYSDLMNSFDQFYDKKVLGIVLLDMDFDGEPEILVSKKTEGEENRNCIDVWVYRLKNGEVILLDTIVGIANDAYGNVYGTSAVLGLKTLENGEKAWFAMTSEYKTDEEKGGCLETGKLITLKNGEIHEEEIFSLWQLPDSPWGLRIYFGDTLAEYSEEEGEQTLRTPWGDFSGGDELTLYYELKNRYCASVGESVFLLSDWLVPTEKNDGYLFVNLSDRFSPSPRDKANAIAFLVDSYCFGDYSGDFGGYVYNFHELPALKPVIYLYPEEETEVSVSVDFPRGGGITCSYPAYNGGWRVSALPDGTLFDENGDEFYCLYWEGDHLPLSASGEGWCVSGEDTAEFLREKLLAIGLTAREANEMIIYWLPQMQENPYNLISFHFEDYDRAAPLTVSPAPDTLIRVFMTYSPSEEWVEIEPQVLPRYTRRGFTAVEWGGCELCASE